MTLLMLIKYGENIEYKVSNPMFLADLTCKGKQPRFSQ